MGYVYIVTRITYPKQEGITEIPNLGVHTSYKKAIRHYQSVREDRWKLNGGGSVSGQCVANHKIYSDARFALLMSDHFPNEEIRLEKWVTGKRLRP